MATRRGSMCGAEAGRRAVAPNERGDDDMRERAWCVLAWLLRVPNAVAYRLWRATSWAFTRAAERHRRARRVSRGWPAVPRRLVEDQ